MKLLVATSNAGKLVEIREIVAGIALELISLRDLRLPPPAETGDTFHANAAQKATISARQSGLWTLADDSGLCVEALGGAPGVHSARYAPTDEERRAKLLHALQGVPEEKRGAHFFCAVALSPPDGERILRAEGRVEGSIAFAERGTNGFGYDPIFLPAETPGQTLAELGSGEKNRLSHRGRALQRLRPVLERLARDGTV
ncbi:MAG TPA: RdgB/HAM1 family non-canonical purine NTP pyrophosphatase [Myxococcales bacterium]|nr:RdgB/HAM1 family non-canonical purine NTP pyrophosphatase [Myxococcales bacterium]